MRVEDIHGWPDDYDLHGLESSWPTTVEMIDVYDVGADHIFSDALARRYGAAYRRHGPWALPPIVCVGGVEGQVTGAHRMRGAFLAGLRQLPAFIVQVPS